jgi:hypothetical protein
MLLAEQQKDQETRKKEYGRDVGVDLPMGFDEEFLGDQKEEGSEPE